MSEHIPFDQDDARSAERPAAGPAPWTRRRRITVAGAAAVAVLALGGGTAALAATTHSAGSSSTPAYEGPGARPGGGGPLGDRGPHTPHLDGTVTAVTSSSITIKDHDGFTRTIVVSSATTYSGGLSAKPTVGTAIHAEGRVDSNGTSLDATTVTKDTGPAGGGPGHGRGPGRGPAGAPGSGATPPSAGATPPSAGATPPASSSAAPSASPSGS